MADKVTCCEDFFYFFYFFLLRVESQVGVGEICKSVHTFRCCVTWDLGLISSQLFHAYVWTQNKEYEVFKSSTGRANFSKPGAIVTGWELCICAIINVVEEDRK